MAYSKNSGSKHTHRADNRAGRPKPGHRFSGKRRGSGKQSRADKKFDPSLFIKKVEEQIQSIAYVPKNTFADFLIEDQLKANIANKGYTIPTPIQDQVIPVLLEGKDVIATANTGTGKTGAFLIPLINNVLAGSVHRALILAPTRELALQIQDELKLFVAKLPITSALCIGGVNMSMQTAALAREPQFVIGTPGRLMDLEQNGYIRFSQFNAVVLDEVDTMLDMGFIKDIRQILKKLPAKRQSLFFSATISPEIKKVMSEFLHHPVSISVKTRESGQNVNQDIVKVAGKNKIDVLHDLLIKPDFTKVIIFMRTKRAVDKLARILTDRGFKVATIHGDKTQAARNRALSSFAHGSVRILLATDVVARGIDIDDVSHVINFDLPQTYEDYIHRIGRTGRADKIGQALTFVE